MVLIGLLLLALACLILGLVLASAAWLIGSLVASVAAAFVLWQTRARIGSGAPSAAHTAKAAPTASAPAAPAKAEAASAADEPELDQDYLARRAAWFAEGTRSGDVWVVDGRPDYHRAGCGLLGGTGAEPIARSQAVEDGFTPCGTCTPDAVAEPPPDAVWVVDGRPRYHRADCMIISGQQAEPVPYAQASADGFMPCTLCEPKAAPA